MRLRLGDYVVWVDLPPPAQPEPVWQAPSRPSTPERAPATIGHDDFFSLRTEEEPQRPRPADLPDPFEHPRPGAFQAYGRAGSDDGNSVAFDDPFSLDPVASPASQDSTDAGSRDASPFDDPFGLSSDAQPPPGPPAASETARLTPLTFDDGFGLDPKPAAAPVAQPASPIARKPPTEPGPAPWDLPPVAAAIPSPPASVAAQFARGPHPAASPAAANPRQGGHALGDMALRTAFLRGVGLDEADLPGGDPVAEMEKFGREYRLMMDGLMQLLRKRAEEKGNARVAQTVVGATEVNPLKFLPSVDDALATISAERSPGFLAGEPAIADAIRDLAQHHVRAWRGVQGALRRMIDRFDPAAIEEELKSGSAIETLLAGGRGAKLWELYQKRHREIATSAESRFLGEIGTDFRDAYEEE